MPKLSRVPLLLLSLFAAGTALAAQNGAPRTDSRFPLTVDRIMRGADLVGTPEKLTAEAKKSAPPANGRCDKAHRRVLFADYRASSGYGRDWRTAIDLHMGGKYLEEVVDGATFIAATEQVNPKRIGVYGGSYGGFITLIWELAPYRVENHGFERATSWADEYKRILELFEDDLRLQPKGLKAS